MHIDPTIFRDYDIRAIIPDQLDTEGFKRIIQAIIYFSKAKSIQLGHDMRVSSPEFHQAALKTAQAQGIKVIDLGLISTDMLYFAAGKYPEDLAIMISASHNPPQYNGMKIVRQGAIAISGDSGIYQIRDLALSTQKFSPLSSTPGEIIPRNILSEWASSILSLINPSQMKPFKVVIDAGNGMSGYFMPEIETKLSWQVKRFYYELDGTFPHHPANPAEPQNLVDLIQAVKDSQADFGIAFDGDGDRMALVDETGRILSGTISTAIIAANLLQKFPHQTILYNAIIGRVVPETIAQYGGKSYRVRVGHTLIKEAMRQYNALFCGEHSGHYFFRDNYFADSAILAALLIAEHMSISGKTLSALAAEYDKYVVSGEINFEVQDKQGIMQQIEANFKDKAESIDWLDGVTVWFKDYWFNLRPSNTEPLLRLNVEADNQQILDQHLSEVLHLLSSLGVNKEST